MKTTSWKHFMRCNFFHLFACLLGLTVITARALNPALPPGGNFDLSHWYLQLPTAGGMLTGTAGSVDSASASQLVAGFTNAYFFSGQDGAMTFWVPDNGATTSGSTHPRSELREQLVPGNNNTNWILWGTHVMTATCVVSNVPSDTQKVCIGQIHEPSNLTDGVTPGANNEQMIMFDLLNQKIYANINLDGNQSSSFSTTFITGTNVALGNPINYTISVVNGLLQISVNNVANSWNLFSGTNYQGHIATNWDVASGNSVYFKAGDYNQTTNACNCATDGAKVFFYALTRYHAPSITSQPTNRVANAGSNATFSVTAIGNSSPLKYQWRFNGTNISAGATNTSWVVTNTSAAKLGNYSVVVSDLTPGFNSVTSSIAALVLAVAPHITNATVAAGNKSFNVAGSCAAGQNLVLMSTTNLNPPVNWLPIYTNNAGTNGAFSCTDLQATNFPQRFYRLITP